MGARGLGERRSRFGVAQRRKDAKKIAKGVDPVLVKDHSSVSSQVEGNYANLKSIAGKRAFLCVLLRVFAPLHETKIRPQFKADRN
ncbi:MAG: hypothetical protein N4J56_000231 [Chroococcidiopsis sp. SAG 2025]|nr:hypothetical protein [Chroococcidiopsis sp. SAG 2025]